MGDDRKRRYDTFVVRLWRDIASSRFLRAEVEHVQSGRHSEHRWSAANPDNDPGWIMDQLLRDDLPLPGERSVPEAKPPELKAIPEQDDSRFK